MRAPSRLLLAVLLLAASGFPSVAQDFAGKTITIIAGLPPGGGIDGEMRLVAGFLCRFLPGEPKIVAQNMPGAAGIVLANHLAGTAKPDGLTLGMPGRSGFLLAPLVGDRNAHYDLAKLGWIGSSASTNFLFWLRRDIGVTSLAALRTAPRQIVIGGTLPTVSNVIIPIILAKYENLPLRVIHGYPGFNEAAIAAERGEVDGIYTHAASLRPDLISSGLLVPIFQTFRSKSGAGQPDLPAIDDFVAISREKALLDLLIAPSRLGLPLVGPPGMPAGVIAALRRAYVAMATSPDYRAEAARRGFEISEPIAGDEIARYVVDHLASVPPDIIQEYLGYAGGQ